MGLVHPQAHWSQGAVGLSWWHGPWHLTPTAAHLQHVTVASPCRLPGGQCSKTLMVPSCPPTSDKMSTGPMVKKPTMHRYISTKVLLAEGRETPFAEHCRNYENTYRVGSVGQSRMGRDRMGQVGAAHLAMPPNPRRCCRWRSRV